MFVRHATFCQAFPLNISQGTAWLIKAEINKLSIITITKDSFKPVKYPQTPPPPLCTHRVKVCQTSTHDFYSNLAKRQHVENKTLLSFVKATSDNKHTLMVALLYRLRYVWMFYSIKKKNLKGTFSSNTTNFCC